CQEIRHHHRGAVCGCGCGASDFGDHLSGRAAGNHRNQTVHSQCGRCTGVGVERQRRMEFFIDLMTNGLLVGLMYALVAVGFVLIYKATSIINFAQGELVMLAGYAAAVMLGLRGLPLWLMVLILCLGMVALGFVLERGILRPMVGQPLVSVIMVTIG